MNLKDQLLMSETIICLMRGGSEVVPLTREEFKAFVSSLVSKVKHLLGDVRDMDEFKIDSELKEKILDQLKGIEFDLKRAEEGTTS